VTTLATVTDEPLRPSGSVDPFCESAALGGYGGDALERRRFPDSPMRDVVISTGRVLVALLLVAANGFFLAAEFAFVRIRGTSVDELAAEGRMGAGSLQDVMADLDDSLAVTQLGITIASLGLGWVGEPAVASLIEPVLAPVLPAGSIHLVAFAIGFGFVTFLHLVFGKLAPKTIAIAKTERLSLLLAPPMKLC
jgi:CBS domain containing-hemolysin-like protein